MKFGSVIPAVRKPYYAGDDKDGGYLYLKEGAKKPCKKEQEKNVYNLWPYTQSRDVVYVDK